MLFAGGTVSPVAKKRYRAAGFPCNRMKLSSSRGTRIDIPVLFVSWSVVDHSVILQALKKGLIEHEASDIGRSPSLEVLLSRSSGRGYIIYIFFGTLLEEFGGGIGPLL